MSSIHYKFRATLEYKTLQFDGLHITGADLKKEICLKEGIKAEAFDLLLQNAHTKRSYTAEELIPRNSSIIVQRVPREDAEKLPKIQGVNTGIVARPSTAETDWVAPAHMNPVRFLFKLIQVSAEMIALRQLNFSFKEEFEKLSEEDQIAHIKDVSTAKYHSSNFQKKTTNIMSGPPPPTYTCNRCYQPGHWYKNCPMVIMNDARMRHLVAVADEGPAVERVPPPELTCPLCSHLLKDAVLTTCCGHSFCADCISNKLMESPERQCPGRNCDQKQLSVDALVPNKTVRQAAQAWAMGGPGSGNQDQEHMRFRIGLQPAVTVPAASTPPPPLVTGVPQSSAPATLTTTTQPSDSITGQNSPNPFVTAPPVPIPVPASFSQPPPNMVPGAVASSSSSGDSLLPPGTTAVPPPTMNLPLPHEISRSRNRSSSSSSASSSGDDRRKRRERHERERRRTHRSEKPRERERGRDNRFRRTDDRSERRDRDREREREYTERDRHRENRPPRSGMYQSRPRSFKEEAPLPSLMGLDVTTPPIVSTGGVEKREKSRSRSKSPQNTPQAASTSDRKKRKKKDKFKNDPGYRSRKTEREQKPRKFNESEDVAREIADEEAIDGTLREVAEFVRVEANCDDDGIEFDIEETDVVKDVLTEAEDEKSVTDTEPPPEEAVDTAVEALSEADNEEPVERRSESDATHSTLVTRDDTTDKERDTVVEDHAVDDEDRESPKKKEKKHKKHKKHRKHKKKLMRKKGGPLVMLLKRKILNMPLLRRNGGDLITTAVLKGRNIIKSLPVIGSMRKRKESLRVRVAASDTMTDMLSARKEVQESETGAWIGDMEIKVIERKKKVEIEVVKEMGIKAKMREASERETMRTEKKILSYGSEKKTANEKRLCHLRTIGKRIKRASDRVTKTVINEEGSSNLENRARGTPESTGSKVLHQISKEPIVKQTGSQSKESREAVSQSKESEEATTAVRKQKVPVTAPNEEEPVMKQLKTEGANTKSPTKAALASMVKFKVNAAAAKKVAPGLKPFVPVAQESTDVEEDKSKASATDDDGGGDRRMREAFSPPKLQRKKITLNL
ncbi:DWNN domain protein [Ostertagia ostertagi]